MGRADRRRDRVIALCGELVTFLEGTRMPLARPFSERQADVLRARPGVSERRRISRTIYAAANTGAGGMSDTYVSRPDGTTDVEATDAYYRCLGALLRATRPYLWRTT